MTQRISRWTGKPQVPRGDSCRNGHKRTEGGWYVAPSGKRRCAVCIRESNAARYRKTDRRLGVVKPRPTRPRKPRAIEPQAVAAPRQRYYPPTPATPSVPLPTKGADGKWRRPVA